MELEPHSKQSLSWIGLSANGVKDTETGTEGLYDEPNDV